MRFYSTTKIGKMYGLKAKPLVFDFLMQEGFIFRHNNSYHLTALGQKYGKMYKGQDGNEWIVWNEEKIAPIFRSLKKEIVKNHKNKFQLYHMTHIDNLSSICKKGALLSHNQINDYIDISNQSVNSRRSIQEPFYNKSIHDYVPLYFNTRNAMLYTVQRNFGNNIIILEIDTDICLQPYTLFTYCNAATNNALFCDDIIEFLDNENWWRNIRSYTWFDDPTGFTKKAMMSECLILEKIPINYVKNIYCKTKIISDNVCNILNDVCREGDFENLMNIYYDSELFFNI